MMRVSDAERREVAQKLREDPERIGPCDLTDGELLDVIAADVGVRSSCGDFDAKLMDRLADLIDRPTCTNVSARKNNEFLCSECRCQLEITRVTDISPDGLTLVTENVVPGFCPACGAEVVPHAERRD